MAISHFDRLQFTLLTAWCRHFQLCTQSTGNWINGGKKKTFPIRASEHHLTICELTVHWRATEALESVFDQFGSKETVQHNHHCRRGACCKIWTGEIFQDLRTLAEVELVMPVSIVAASRTTSKTCMKGKRPKPHEKKPLQQSLKHSIMHKRSTSLVPFRPEGTCETVPSGLFSSVIVYFCLNAHTWFSFFGFIID